MSLTSEPSTGLRPSDESALRAALHGTVLIESDNDYEDARRLHNGAIDRRPALLVQVASTADIVETLAIARSRGLSVSVKAGGHGVAGHALGGDVVIDLSAMRGVSVDPVARTAVVRAGSTWGEVDEATQAHGLAVPGGRITHTGVAGLTLGGGEGWLSQKYGMSCDNLLSIDLVTADGRQVTACASSAPELFWALRGGGGNFGVATSFTFQLHPVGPLVYGGLLGYRLSDAPEVFAILNELVALGNDDLSPAAVFLKAPPAPFVPGDVVGQPVIGVAPVYVGDPADAAAFFKPLHERVTPLFDASGPMPYVVLQALMDDMAHPGFRHRWAGSFLPQVPAALVSDLQDAAASMPSPLSHIIISPYGGAIARVPADATAYPQRDASWLVHPVGMWANPADDEANLAWVRDLSAKIRSYGETGAYLNLEQGGDERVRWAFGEERYRRLQAIKAAWDPEDVFRHCNHIAPAHPRA